VTAVARQSKASKEALSRLPKLDIRELREEWRFLYKTDASPHLSRELLIRAVAYRMQDLEISRMSGTRGTRSRARGRARPRQLPDEARAPECRTSYFQRIIYV
jgi:hypothetical protein